MRHYFYQASTFTINAIRSVGDSSALHGKTPAVMEPTNPEKSHLAYEILVAFFSAAFQPHETKCIYSEKTVLETLECCHLSGSSAGVKNQDEQPSGKAGHLLHAQVAAADDEFGAGAKKKKEPKLKCSHVHTLLKLNRWLHYVDGCNGF